jgi:CheY-like chemotaxis protein
VTTAQGGRSRPATDVEDLPDLVLLDLFMDDMNGTDVLSHIRTEWGFLPVAIMTARPDSELMQKALMLSPVLLLAKPFTQAQLLAAVRQALPASSPAD